MEKQNKELRAGLQEVRVKIAKLSNTIELENRPAGFDIPVGWMHSRFSSVTARLHEELLVFRAEVEQKMKKIEELAQTICSKLQTLVKDIDPELDVPQSSH